MGMDKISSQTEDLSQGVSNKRVSLLYITVCCVVARLLGEIKSMKQFVKHAEERFSLLLM